MLYLDELPNSMRRIQEMDVKVCVIGVGTIGLPLATFLAKAGFQVTGLDIDQKRVDQTISWCLFIHW
jgi:UDP-N-acetyl-D-glucosamine dehydrogenase